MHATGFGTQRPRSEAQRGFLLHLERRSRERWAVRDARKNRNDRSLITFPSKRQRNRRRRNGGRGSVMRAAAKIGVYDTWSNLFDEPQRPGVIETPRFFRWLLCRSSEFMCPIWVGRLADPTTRKGCKESLDQDTAARKPNVKIPRLRGSGIGRGYLVQSAERS
jgi:hypothetical protein